jgi:putative ABC transport system substrate-binding protein
MDRRKFLAIATGALAAPLAVEAQQQPAKKVYRIGLLISGTVSSHKTRIEAFRQGLRELGYVETHNIALEYRYAEGRTDRFPDLASELVALQVDVIVTSSNAAVLAAKKATGTIPIVFASANDPVGTGLVASLAQPGGNATGLTNLSSELGGKRLALLKEIFPKVTRVGYLTSPQSLGAGEVKAAAHALGLHLQSLSVRTSSDFDRAFDVALRERVQALMTSPAPVMNSHRTQIVDFAIKNRLPAVYPDSAFVNAGGLMSYAPSLPDLWRRAAILMDRILKGVKPAELPVEQPTKFELVINLKTAKALGLTIPPSLLLRADQVIE